MEPHEKINVLIIDDNPDQIVMFEAILDRLGVNLVSATSGNEGLQKLLEEEYACVVLDVNMPIMDGFETAKLIRSNPDLTHIPIIFVTANNTTLIDMYVGYAVGGAEYLITPLIPEILRAKVKVFIELFENTKLLQKQKLHLKESNITAIKQAQHLLDVNNELIVSNQELENIIKSRDNFFAIIAHDLKGPLSSVLSLTEILCEEAAKFPVEQLSAIYTAIHKSIHSVHSLLENLLLWARVQKGTIEFLPKELNFSESFSQTIDLIRANAILKGIEVTNEVSRSLRVYADEKMLNTILRNLLSNAMKFTKKDGKVILRACEKENQTVEISITDTGIGISEEMIDKLFIIDQRVGRIGTGGEPSNGLGLLLVKEFVEKHDGRIWVESKPEKGSTFSISLPRK